MDIFEQLKGSHLMLVIAGIGLVALFLADLDAGETTDVSVRAE